MDGGYSFVAILGGLCRMAGEWGGSKSWVWGFNIMSTLRLKQTQLDRLFAKKKGTTRMPKPRKTKQQSDIEMALLPNDLLNEDQIQIKLFNWAKRVKFGDTVLYEYMHHSPNGGMRTTSEAGKFKMMGVKAGYPDIILDIARGGYHGLRIELKVKRGGKVSPEQKEWIARLTEQGYLAMVCKGYDVAQQAIIDYMSIGRNAKHDLECDVCN